MTSFWNVAKTKRRNGIVVVDNSSETFHRFLFSVFFSEFFLHGPSVSDWRLIGLRCPSTPPSPSPLFSDLPRSVRQPFFSGSGPNSRPETSSVSSETCYNLFFCQSLSFFFSTNNRERGKNSRFFWFRFGYFFPVEEGIYRNRDHSSRSVRSELFLWPL